MIINIGAQSTAFNLERTAQMPMMGGDVAAADDVDGGGGGGASGRQWRPHRVPHSRTHFAEGGGTRLKGWQAKQTVENTRREPASQLPVKVALAFKCKLSE